MKSNKVSKLDSAYPSSLLGLSQVPDPIYYRGSNPTELLTSPAIAIVGTRKVTPYGRLITAKLASELARSGVVIVSGLALGVDSIAHAAAIDAGGITMAVLPCGIDTVYPSSHNYLAQKILDGGGTLLSEYTGKDRPQKYQFIARNRIIAALGQGVLIPEAAAKSGSLHTADFALELGIDVLAVPGNINSPMSEGTNGLIKAGATPITSTQDVLDALHILPTQHKTQVTTSKPETLIIELLQNGVTDQHTMLMMSKLNPETFQSALTLLEINDQITPGGPSCWALK